MSTRFDKRGLAAVLAAAFCALSGCSANMLSGAGPSPQDTATSAVPDATSLKPRRPSGPVRIGMLVPLSGLGPAAATGKGLKQAGEMALFELDNPLVQLIVKDDKGTPEGAAAAAGEAIAEGAEIIVGPITSAATAAVAPVARRSNVPVLSFSNDRRVAGNGVYLMSTLPEQEIDRIISFAAGKGHRSIAALIPNDNSSAVFETSLRTTMEKQKVSLAALTRYPTEPNAMLLPVRDFFESLKQTGGPGSTPPVAAASALPSAKPGQGAFAVDAIFVAGTPDALTQMSSIITYSGVQAANVKVLGTSSWDYPNAGRNSALVGGWYAGPEPRGWQDFTQRFTRSFGQTPPRIASLSYEAVSLAITLSSFEPGQRYTVTTLTRPQGFQGVDGPVRLKPDGTAERPLAIIEMQAFGGNVIDMPFGAGEATSAIAPAQVITAAPPPPVSVRPVAQPGSPGPLGGPGGGPPLGMPMPGN